MQINLPKALLVATVLIGGTCIDTCFARLASRRKPKGDGKSYAVVANRKGGSVSFIPEDASPDGTSVGVTLQIEGSEPMYVNANEDTIFVGDRARNVFMVFDPAGIGGSPVAEILVDGDHCQGLFHQSLNHKYLVATCTETKSIVVVDVRRSDMAPVKYIDLDIGTCVPHDIVINKTNKIFVTTVDNCEQGNEIIKFNAASGKEEGRINLGSTPADPHVALDPTNDDFLYSPQQKLDRVVIYDQKPFQEVQVLKDVDNAHGICFAPDGSKLYVTDINGSESDGKRLIEIKPRTRMGNAIEEAKVMGVGDFKGSDVAHNCAVTDTGKIFVTHSGATAELVTLFNHDDTGLINLGDFTSGLNPFGIGIFKGPGIENPV